MQDKTLTTVVRNALGPKGADMQLVEKICRQVRTIEKTEPGLLHVCSGGYIQAVLNALEDLHLPLPDQAPSNQVREKENELAGVKFRKPAPRTYQARSGGHDSKVVCRRTTTLRTARRRAVLVA